MYLRTLLYALRQGVALDSGGAAPKSSSPTAASTAAVDDAENVPNAGSTGADEESFPGKVPDRLLDMYLSAKDSISLTSKVLDVYAAYVDEGEVRPAEGGGGADSVPARFPGRSFRSRDGNARCYCCGCQCFDHMPSSENTLRNGHNLEVCHYYRSPLKSVVLPEKHSPVSILLGD